MLLALLVDVSGLLTEVVWVAPICAGSGLPEAKSYLNGNFVANMFEPRNFLVRPVVQTP